MTYDTFHTPIPWKSSTAPEGGDTNKVRCQLDKHVATLIRGSARSFQTSIRLHNTPVIRPCVLIEKLSHWKIGSEWPEVTMELLGRAGIRPKWCPLTTTSWISRSDRHSSFSEFASIGCHLVAQVVVKRLKFQNADPDLNVLSSSVQILDREGVLACVREEFMLTSIYSDHSGVNSVAEVVERFHLSFLSDFHMVMMHLLENWGEESVWILRF